MKKQAARVFGFCAGLALIAVMGACNKSSGGGSSNNAAGSMLFVQNASAGTLTVDTSGNYTLAVESIDPFTIFFSDTPQRRGGSMPTGEFATLFFEGRTREAPNADVQWLGAGGRNLSITISSMTYDAATQTATYQGQVISADDSETGTSIPLTSLPHELANIAVFIDDLFEVSCNAALLNNSSQTLTIVSINSTPYGDQGWSASFSPGDQVPPGGSISASISDAPIDCSAGITFSTPSGATFEVSFDNSYNSSSSFSCTNVPANIVCGVDGNDHGQPLNVNFAIIDAP